MVPHCSKEEAILPFPYCQTLIWPCHTATTGRTVAHFIKRCFYHRLSKFLYITSFKAHVVNCWYTLFYGYVRLAKSMCSVVGFSPLCNKTFEELMKVLRDLSILASNTAKEVS